VAKLFQLSDYRDAFAPSAPHGDWDLAPVAGLLWIGSVVRVGLGMTARESFDAEGTLALACVVLIPLWALWSWACHEEHPADPANDDDDYAPVIALTDKRRLDRSGT